MRCKFCPNKKISQLGPNLYNCGNCKAYYDFRDDILIQYFHYFTYNEKIYSMHFRMYPIKFVICDEYRFPILTWDYFPNLTPHNIMDKMPTILTFL